jgi:hypothetical protein
MATKKQKQELVDILKFTPIKVTMTIQGYGGESYAGRVDRKIYEYFKERKLDLEQYASDWDNEMNVPDEMQPFTPGSPYDCDGMFHASGAELTDLNQITITDEKGDTVWEHDMGWSSLEDAGVAVEEFSNVDFDDLEEGEVVFWGGQGEKGCFFDCEFTLTQPFDPKKLVIKFESCDGWQIVNYVEYNGEDLDGSGGYSTTGKWAENKWVLGGDEEVYEAEEFDPDAESSEEWDPAEELDKIKPPEGFDWSPLPEEPAVTDWFDKDTNPAYKGDYEVVYDAAWPLSGMGMAEWTGRSWKQNGKKLAILKWRGLAENPNT